MDELLELTHIIRHHSQRSLQLVNQNFRKNEKSKDNLLYSLIVRGKISNDEEAARALLNTRPGNRNYRNAKSKLRQKLMNQLFFLDMDKNCYTEFKKAHYECILKLGQLKILMMEGKPWIALKRIPVLVKTAMEYELVEIALEGMLLLRNEYSIMGKYNIQSSLEDEIDEIKPFHKAIIECEGMFYDTLVVINKSQKSCDKIAGSLQARISEIQNASTKFKSRRLDILAKKLSIRFHHINKKYEEVLKVCDYLEEKYIPGNKKKITVNLNPSVIASYKLDAYYMMNDSRSFDLYCRQNAYLFLPGAPEWFTLMEYWFLLLMKSGKYSDAVEIFKDVRSHRLFSKSEWDIRERWTIYRSYLCYTTGCRSVQWGFNAGKFLTLKPGYPKQYSNYGFAVLLARVLFALKDGNIPLISETICEMQKFGSSHLDKRHNYRNSIFIRMLDIVLETEFDYELIKEKDSVYLQKLHESSRPADPSVELEVIPYEQLWDHILDILKTNKHYRHYRFYHYQEVS